MGNTFGISVPKGHIEVLDAAAENLIHVGHSADRAGNAMRRAAEVDGWQGSASEAFTHTIVQSATPADVAERELPRAAKALSELADDLRTARRATEHAVDRARAADKRREEAERDATAAQTKVINHNAEATALEGVIQGAAGRGDPASASREAQRDAKRAAGQAEEALSDAKRRIQKAIEHVEDAQRDGRAANERYDDACRRAAKVLQSVAAAAPNAGKGQSEDGALSWDDVYRLLLDRPGEKRLPVAALALGLLKIANAKSFLKAQGQLASWARLPPARAAELFARLQPTLNNSPFMLKAADKLAKVPALGRGLGWLTSVARNPLLKKVSVVAGGVAIADDLSKVASGIRNKTWEDDPAAFVSDIAKTGFDVSTTAFLVAPNPYTGGAVIVTGVIWGATEVWDHWDGITGALDDAKDYASDKLDDAVDGAKDLVGDIGGGLAGVFT